MLTGLHFSVYIRSFFYNEFAITENDYLKLITSWNFGLSKAKYQFMLISDSNNLKNNCIPSKCRGEKVFRWCADISGLG